MVDPSVAASGIEGTRIPARCRAAPSSCGTGSPPGRILGSCAAVICRPRAVRFKLVGDEFEQRAIGITEVDAGTGAFRPKTLHRPGMNGDAPALEMGNGVNNGPMPLEAQIAVSRLHRQSCNLGGVHSRPMQVELHGAETIGPALPAANELGAKHISVEGIRAFPLGDMH